ncbi:MAG: zinc ribbon domain-containing protein [Candidatus Omnitrophica bacterium]|nr:zinc ribbon domain-containing protein [Candidatus Omnitrophota bacterium]
MALLQCPECRQQISDQAVFCPQCGMPRQDIAALARKIPWRALAHMWWIGYEWKSKATIGGWPLVHIAIGRSRQTGRLLVARGMIAIGQFAYGVITVAQFGVGILFGFGQFIAGVLAIGQFAAGIVVIAQFALGVFCLAQAGLGSAVWSVTRQDPAARIFFRQFRQLFAP